MFEGERCIEKMQRSFKIGEQSLASKSCSSRQILPDSMAEAQ